jgi:hypothetical protein
MSKALSSTEREINHWLGMQLSDLPGPANQPDYTAFLSGKSPLKSIRELLETIINRPCWSLEIARALEELGIYFNLPVYWWKNRGLGDLHWDSIAAAFADAWIYLQWLRLNSPKDADQFADFFAKSVMHPEWVEAVDSMWHHYPLVGGNLHQTIPFALDLMYPEQLKRTPWYPRAGNKMGQELILRAHKAANWLYEIFTSKEEEKAQKLESGLSHISLAAIKGDRLFFIGLGKALSETFEPPENLSLEQIQKQPTSTSKGRKDMKNRPWCRRIWISRGLWLLPKHLLEQSPFSLSTTTTNELTGNRYKGNKRRSQYDELYQAKSPWFNEWRGEDASISLRSEGKKQFPQFAETGYPWSIVSADIEEPE